MTFHTSMGTLRLFFLRALTVLLLTGFVRLDDCPAEDNESLLQSGQEYSYHFKAEAYGESVGTTNDRSKMLLDCNVHISHNHDCFYNMKLSQCTLTAAGGPPDSEVTWIDHQEMEEISRHSVMFSLDNGKISQVYVSPHDPIMYVNIKRGALSSFVLKASAASKEVLEMHTDIHGVCPFVSFRNLEVPGGIRARKDMLQCSFPSRPDWQFSPWSIFWNMSFIQHVINSTTDCDYVVNIEEKRLDKVHCKERHAIMLESTHRTTTAVQTNIFYSMDLISSSELKEAVKIDFPSRKTDICFEYNRTPDPENIPGNFFEKFKELLSDLVETSQEEIRLFTIPMFTDLVAWLRTSNDLTGVDNRIDECTDFREKIPCTDENKELAKSYLRDALVQCNTVPCIEAISNIAVKGDMSTSYLNFVLYSWGNMHFTKPRIVKYIKKICESKDSRFCWLSLGSIIGNIYRRVSHDKEQIGELKLIVSELNYDFEYTLGLDTDDKKYFKMLTFLKTFGNIEGYQALNPSGVVKIFSIALHDSYPVFIKIEALETLSKIGPCYSLQECSRYYHKLQSNLHNSSIDVDVRISIYNLFMSMPETWNFEDDLVRLLKEEKNSQFLSYISSNLENVMSDSQYKVQHNNFIQKLTKLLQYNDIVLEDFKDYKEQKSYSSSYGGFVKLPFMPLEMDGFGFKIDTSAIFPYYNMIPATFRSNFTVQLFDKFMNWFQSKIHIEGWEGLSIVIQKILLEMNPESFSLEQLSNILRDIVLILNQPPPDSPDAYHFSENIIKNILKVHDMQKNKSKSKLFYSLDVNMLRSALSFLTSSDMSMLSSVVEDVYELLDKLREGITSRNTHVIRVIEAYHQVPTMMGLPLNWTTNATLAFSFNYGLKLKYSDQDKSDITLDTDFHFNPSTALTFLNRMVLDFPTVTQMGIQANSSGYTSTQWKAAFSYSSASRNVKLSIKKPEKSQKVLELFRTNQIIKHNDYIDMADWDITRTSSEWCSDKSKSSVFGLQMCHERSYPVVTHLIKPWALMAGWCKWRLEINPYDSELEYYNMELKLPDENSVKKYLIKFYAPGSEFQRTVIIDASVNTVNKETAISVRVPEAPNFEALASRNNLLEKDQVTGYRSVILLKLTEDMKYQLSYTHEDRSEKKTEKTDDENKSPKSKKHTAFTAERLLRLETPFNDYKWSRKMHVQGRNFKNDIMITYDNHKPDWNWVRRILPPLFWQTNTKAWVQIRSNWKLPTHKMKDTKTSLMKTHVTTPKTYIELQTNSLKMPGREQLNVNLTKTEKSTNKLLAFANFTYDLWSSESSQTSSKEIRIFNFTIPRKSWGLQLQKVADGNRLLYEATLTRAKMVEKNNIQSDYIGWWSESQSHLFDLKQYQFHLSADLVTKILDSMELSNELPDLVHVEDIQGLSNKYLSANIGLHYPYYNKAENVNFNGKFIISGSADVFRYQKNFVLHSSYHNLHLTSHSVYKALTKQKLLSHNSFFTHTTSGKKAFYNLDFLQVQKENGCLDINFNHNISSSVFDMSGNISYHCISDGSHMHLLRLDSLTYSPHWNMLNTEIKQVIEDITPDYTQEYMNFTHPLMIINVTADWRGKTHKKRAVFTTLPENEKVLEINLQTEPKKVQLNVDIQDERETKLIYKRKVSNDYKQLQISIHSPDNNLINLNGKVIDPQNRIWKLEVYPKFSGVLQLLQSFRTSIMETGAAIAKDPNHPLNIMLHPVLDMPLAEYFSSMKQQLKHDIYQSWNAIKEAIWSVETLYQPAFSVITNAFNEGMMFLMKAYAVVKEKSVIVWAINYFELPQILQKGLLNIPDGFAMLQNIMFPGNDVVKLTFHTGRILSWNSFNELPYFSSEKIQNYIPVKIIDSEDKIKPHRQKTVGSKIAMIFGPLHVYTFDGHVYEFPQYPESDCSFLLLHDIHKSMFSAISTPTLIHILFPEMTVSINPLNEVFINNSESSSSLPIHSGNGKVVVKRHGDVVEVWSPLLTVLCYSKGQLCSLELSGWHGGGTVGLLGNADGEISNEYMLPDGTVTDSLLEFARSYELSGRDECQNLVLSDTRTTSTNREQCLTQMKNICSYFSHLSSPFSESCAIDVNNGDDMCYAISGLSTLCYFQNQDAKSNCFVQQQESKNIRHKLQIVFLVNEHLSMFRGDKSIPYKGLESVIDAIEEQFRKNGYSSVLYSLVGFGGKGSHYYPSIHTVDSNIWVPHKKAVNDLLKTLEFKGLETFSPLTAIKYAAEVLGHDTFDTKVFIMFNNDDNETSDRSLFNSVHRYLEKNGITLYTFASYPTLEKGKKVFGVRADGLMFPSPKKEEAYLDYPSGDLAKLTSATRGSLFLHKFVESNSPSSFFTEFAQEVWAKVRREVQQCRDCKTVRSGWWYYYNRCRIVKC